MNGHSGKAVFGEVKCGPVGSGKVGQGAVPIHVGHGKVGFGESRCCLAG